MDNLDRPLVGIPCRSDGSTIYKGQHINAQNSTYVAAIIQAGGVPFLIPTEARGETLRTLYELADGILLTGGGDVAPQFFGETPRLSLDDVQSERDEMEFTLVRWALEKRKPLLGICRGIQVMNVAVGGTLYQDIASQCPGADRHDFFTRFSYPPDFLAHPVAVEHGSQLGATSENGRLSVNSLHHQALKYVPPVYQVAAHSPDDIIEGIEVPDHPFAIGVQWHPEELVASQETARNLFLAFVDACRNGRSGSQSRALKP